MRRHWQTSARQLLVQALKAAVVSGSLASIVVAPTYGQSCDQPSLSPAPCACDGCSQFLQSAGSGVDCSQPAIAAPTLGSPAAEQPSPAAALPSDQVPTPPETAPSTAEPSSMPSMDQMLSNPASPMAAADNSFAATPPIGGLASNLGTSAGGAGVPDMIGDFFGNGLRYAFVGGPNGATVGVAGGDRRMKFAENNSPFPRNRLFFNYNMFANALTDPNGRDVDVNRYTFGFERAFYDNMISTELRIPFAGTLSTTPTLGQSSDGTEFGNIALAFKGLLYRDECTALSTGLAVILPTGGDFVIQGDNVIDNRFRNEAVHLQPFLGLYYAPSPRVFTQYFTQLDFDTNGNNVSLNGQTDRLHDQTLLYLDMSCGYWLYQNSHARYFRSFAPMIELHYSTSLQNQSYGVFDANNSTNSFGGLFIQDYRRDVLNLTGGLFFNLTSQTTVKLGGVAPLRTDSDRQFDSEFGIQVTRLY